MKKRPLYGIGKNDANYKVCVKVNGKKKFCPFYRKWVDMLRRCYSPEYHIKFPSYSDCQVCEEWRTFSKFKSWMQSQDWQGKHLDKDLIFPGNKIYSPESCALVDSATNLFTTCRDRCRGDLPVGVFINKKTGKFRSQCGNPFTGKKEMLGTFASAEEAHESWRARKHQLACEWASVVSDCRVKKALMIRYAKY